MTVTERIRPDDAKGQRGRANVLRVISFLFKYRAFIAICIAGMLLLASNMFTQTYYLYLFNSYFDASGLYIVVNVATYLPMLAVMPFMAIGVVLRYMYPISRKVLLELQVQKEAIRGKI